LGLFAIVEWTAELQRGVLLGKAKALLIMLEPAPPADAEGGAGEDDRRDALEQEFAQDRANVDRGAGQGELLLPGGRAVEPIDLVGPLLVEPVAERVAERLAAVRGRFEFDLLFLVRYALADAVDGAGELQQFFRQRIRHCLGLTN